MKPLDQDPSDEQKTTIIEDDPTVWPEPCRHPQHDPPGMIVIPHGKRLRHTCPGCHRTVIVRPSAVYMSRTSTDPLPIRPSDGTRLEQRYTATMEMVGAPHKQSCKVAG